MLFTSYLYKLLQAQRLLVDGVNPRLIDVPEGFGCQNSLFKETNNCRQTVGVYSLFNEPSFIDLPRDRRYYRHLRHLFKRCIEKCIQMYLSLIIFTSLEIAHVSDAISQLSLWRQLSESSEN